ncbi:MAG: hypothetical protein IJZ93_03505 [Clostridia bacterium]|nr:hypothetical protein [Clostridia bacterium]
MKRFLTLSLVVLMLCTIIIPVSAANYDDQVMPCYNNVLTVNREFQISEDGVGTVTLNYIGYATTTGATITSKVQKSTTSGWQDVTGAAWTDETSTIYATINHTVDLTGTGTGTYRLVYEFEIRGSGAADEISGTVEATY